MIELFIESLPLFRNAIFAGIICGAVLGAIGVYVVAQRIVFLAATTSQIASLGVVLGFFVPHAIGAGEDHFHPLAWSAVLAVLGVTLLSRVHAKHRDNALGIGFLFGSAGTLAVSGFVVEELQDISTLLFGSAVAVDDEGLLVLLTVLLPVLALHLFWMRGFVSVTRDPIAASAQKLPVNLLIWTLLATVALSISVATYVIGALPAFAFCALPGMVVLGVTSKFRTAFFIAAVLGALAGIGGYFAAFVFELPVGASQTLVLCGMLALRALWTTVANR